MLRLFGLIPESIPPRFTIGCFLPLHNRLQLGQRSFVTNIISVSISITVYKDLALAIELVTNFKVKINGKDYGEY